MEHIKHDETKTKGFFSYVFSWNDTTKHQLTNLWQFITLAFISLVLLIQLLNKYYPNIDETKSSIEIILLLLFYLYILFFSIYYITRVICYIPTISGEDYGVIFNNSIYLLPLTLSILTSIISYDPNFKEGIFVLFERLTEAWNGGDKKKKKKKTQEQPSQENISAPQMISQPIAPLYTGNTTPIHQLPPPQEGYQNQNYSPQQEYQQANIPMAANEMGSAFSSF
jgi:hypothetical protein